MLENGVRKEQSWTVDLKTLRLSPSDLSEIFQKFFAEVKKEKDQALTISDWLKLEQQFIAILTLLHSAETK